MKELRECIRELKSIQARNTSMRDVVLPIIDALEAIDESILALERATPRKDVDVGGSPEGGTATRPV
jgi:hypothetical protein